MTPEIGLLSIGILFLAGLALDKVGHIVHVPRVTLLILLGVVLGPPVLNILPFDVGSAHEIVAPTALTMVAFLMGGSLDKTTLAAQGRSIVIVSIVIVIVTAILVSAGLWLVGASIVTALLLGGIATATDPAATMDVVKESGRRNAFTRLLTGIVAIDDAWGLLAFSAMMALAGLITATDGSHAILDALWETGGAVALGVLIGVPGAYLSGRIKPGEPTLIEALGLVFLVAGIGLMLDVSYLIAGMTTGAVIANFATHHTRAFHAIQSIEWPFLLLFFVMAGASLDVSQLLKAGLIGVAFVILRFTARLVAGAFGAKLAGLPVEQVRHIGAALMPQAGVAVGMAIVAAERFPDHGEAVLAITVASTIFFEIIGPPLTQRALAKVPD
ncbi:cation:proton antiporter [Octadecabacter sp. CECT 8868]|uniref:cation:proton antiporter n=1 Tax=Octadecabacter algicola TaxID=2909342 RepID=UPI001F17EB1D|nr:cation:proton antiporter [Octadecabacter algicola]MCF2903653.1 cation:proton antiporter [Octadecabacter algicola]